MKHSPTIILAGGGSGGHTTPLLSLGHALKTADPSCKLILIGLKGDILEKDLQSKYQVFDKVCTVTSGKFRRYHGQSFLAHLVDLKTLLLNIRDFFRVLRGILQARMLLKTLAPDVVFSKGGYVIVPVGIAAHWQKIPIITHDSDAIPGLANRIVGRWAKVHATGMPAGFYSYPEDSIRYTGIPVDERIKPVTAKLQADYKKALGLPADCEVLLVGGAGLGSLSINNKVIEISQRLLASHPNLRILHFTGPAHEEESAKKYQEVLGTDLAKKVTVMGFSSDFYKYSGAADLVVTRAGATTLAELALQAKAALLVPAAFLTGGHQLKNAKELEEKNAAVVVSDETTADKLYKTIDSLLDDNKKRSSLASSIAKTAKPAAAAELARLVLSVANGDKVGPD